MLGKRYLLLGIALGGFVLLGSAEDQPESLKNGQQTTQEGQISIAPTVRPVNAVKAKHLLDFTKEQCAECHEDEVASFNNTTHARAWHSGELPCATCHGDPAKHLETQGGKGTMKAMADMSPSAISDMCLSCHEQTGEQSHMRQSEHMLAGISCLDCHDVHPGDEVKNQRTANGQSAMMRAAQKDLCTSCHTSVGAQLSMPTHHRVKEGVVNCTDCHNPHGSAEKHQLRADTKTLCVKCHQDKRGPFTFEHNAKAIDGCLGCHQPHGSSGPHLWKARDGRTLCISCHSREVAAGVPHGRAGLQATGDCTRCHSEMHGSNASPFFTQ